VHLPFNARESGLAVATVIVNNTAQLKCRICCYQRIPYCVNRDVLVQYTGYLQGLYDNVSELAAQHGDLFGVPELLHGRPP
jgi:hypothetical protein